MREILFAYGKAIIPNFFLNINVVKINWIALLVMGKWEFSTNCFIEKLKKTRFYEKLIANHKINFFHFSTRFNQILYSWNFFLHSLNSFSSRINERSQLLLKPQRKTFFSFFYCNDFSKFLTQLHQWVGEKVFEEIENFLLDKNKFTQRFNSLSSLVRFSCYLHTY